MQRFLTWKECFVWTKGTEPAWYGHLLQSDMHTCPGGYVGQVELPYLEQTLVQGVASVRAMWFGHNDLSASVKFILHQDMYLPSAWRKWAQKKLTQLLVLRLKMLTQQLVVMCDQPIPAVAAWDFKAVLLLGSFCTAEQTFHKTQSRFSDSHCRKYHQET